MSHKVCKDVGSWVTSNVQQQVEQWIEQDCNWWCLCCNKWLGVFVWVVVTITTWVVETVCEIVTDVVDTIVIVIRGLWDILAGIFTFDGTRILAGLGEIVGGVVTLVANLIPIVTLGTLVGAFIDQADAWSLRNFAKELIDAKYKDGNQDTYHNILAALGFTRDGFGLRLQCRALRTFIRSDFSSDVDGGGTPDLIKWNQNGAVGIDVKKLAGFNPDAWWSRNWPELIGDSGNISDVDIDNYIANNGMGENVKQFTLFSMNNGDLQTRLDTAVQHAAELGLVLKWGIEDVRITDPSEILIDVQNFPSILTLPPFSRNNSTVNPSAATSDLCTPMSIGVFGFKDSFLGISAHLADSTCLEAEPDGSVAFPGEHITGSAFRIRYPDMVFKYTAIHELGHTFGLCHVDGLLRIMFTNAADEKKSVWSWSSVLQYWTNGFEAGFTLDEGKKVWTYIVENFSSDCLQSRPF